MKIFPVLLASLQVYLKKKKQQKKNISSTFACLDMFVYN